MPIALGCFVVGALLSCSDRATRGECYQPFTPTDGTTFCEWGPGELPDPPEPSLSTHQVSLAFAPTQDMPCDPCDVEAFDALLRAEIETVCDQPYELMRGCYIRPEETTNGSCWVAGVYFSDCNPP